MDANTLVKLMLSQGSTQALGKNTNTSAKAVTDVLSSVLPQLLNGASQQATNKNTAAGFLAAMEQHGQKDTKDLAGFLSQVDAKDGAKIIQHLLGSSTEATVKNAAKAAGVKADDAMKIMSNAAPLLMSVLGQQNKKQQNKATTGGSELITSLMSGMISNSLSGAKSSKSNGIDASDVLNLVGKMMKK